jgi:diacylglycerol kinase (ATP)
MSGALVVVNRGAGGGRGGTIWNRISVALPALAGARVVMRPDVEAALAELRAALDAGGVERVVAVGGDGTLSRVADLLLSRAGGAPVPIPLGVVPAGTGSDLAKALGLPKDPRAALERALCRLGEAGTLAAATRAVDALEIQAAGGRRRFAVNVVSAGVSGQVDEAVADLARRGRATYFTATLRALARYRPPRCRVAVDGEPWHEGELLLLAVANGPTFGRGMRIAPGAELDDGLADVVLVPRLPGWQVPIQMPKLYRGTHLASRYVRWRRGGTVLLEPLDERMPPLDVDGDPWPAEAVTVVVRRRVLRIVV